MTLLAKSDPPQLLSEHLTEVRTSAQALLTPGRIRAFERVGLGAIRAEELLLSEAWLHDWGKATTEWQASIRSGQQRLPQHSLTGFLACLWATGINGLENLPCASLDLLAMGLAVLGHHGQLSDGSFDEYSPILRHEKITVEQDAWRELLVDVPLRSNTIGLPKTVSAIQICQKVKHAKARLKSQILPVSRKFRGLYSLLLTLLVQADHAASGGHAPDTRVVTQPHRPGTLTTFQEKVSHHPEDVLCAVAGCGSGKTLAALLRVAEYAAAIQADRIVLCLPTRFTGNSLLRDMSDPEKYAYPQNQVGLVHSEALQVLRRRNNEDEEDFSDNPDEIASKSVRYEMPVTISTVDHLLMSLYHGYKFADRAFGNLLSSLVVFDEVHAYDSTTLNAIREGFNVLSHYDIPTLFMSATLPSSRRRFFGFDSKRTEIEVDNPYNPFRIERLRESLTFGRGVAVEASDEARRYFREAGGLKLAVYVNQVERAKALAQAAREELPRTTIFCYHSELAPRDRQALEQKVIDAFKRDEPVILIATQAAELSLDISAERMITELAPADVLVQRGGRLNRRGVSPELVSATPRLPQGFVFQLFVAPIDLSINEKGECPAAFPYKEPSLLQRTWDTARWGEVFNFKRGLEWCEAVLTDDPPTMEIGLTEAARVDSAFGKKPQENFAGEDHQAGVVIRDIDDNYTLVIPEDYIVQLPNTLIGIAQYQVPVRQSKYHSIDSGFIEVQSRNITYKHGKKIESIDYAIKIVKSNLPYLPEGGGFQFRTGNVTSAHSSDDTFF